MCTLLRKNKKIYEVGRRPEKVDLIKKYQLNYIAEGDREGGKACRNTIFKNLNFFPPP